jgi:transposase
MPERDPQAKLFPDEKPRDDVVVINGRCVLRVDGDQRVVLAGGLPVAHFKAGDRMAEANAMVLLVEHGYAQQAEAARAFGCDVRSVRRFQRRYEEGGLAALLRVPGYPKGRPRERARDRHVGKLKATGCSNREIGRRLGIDEKAVRKRLRRLGWKSPPPPVQLAFLAPAGADPNLSGPPPPPVGEPATGPPAGADPNLSGPSSPPAEEIPFTLDADPANRKVDRFFAFLGLLDDAAPLFRDGIAVPGAGVLLAVPDLVATGVVDAARKVWGSIGPAFYGLRTTVMTMLLMALLRIQRPEALKERSPSDFGRVLGLDRAPEVKTLRRKLTRFAQLGGVETFGRLLAQRRVTTHGPTLGFLYIDGHVRIYYGKRRIPKTHAARINAVESATTDYWVNDQQGDPLLVVTALANASTTAMLSPLLDEIRKLVGSTRRVTVVFDRGGYSPKLWAKILAGGFDILTYRKGKWRNLPRRSFAEKRATIDGHKVSYDLADQEVRVGGLKLRQITRRQGDHQTPVLTSRRDLAAVEVAYRMFARWRQENFFKYLREEYLLDALIDHQIEPDDPTREIPNPKWAAADAKLREARAEITKLQRAAFVGHTLDALDGTAPTRRRVAADLKTRHLVVWAAMQRALILAKRRDRIPRRVPVANTTDQPIIKLATQRKHLSNVLKMVAYQAESELVRAVTPHYKRAEEEGRTLIQTALASPADIAVTPTELRVTLAPLSSPHRSRAIAALCDKLNATGAVFPGTRLRLRYAVAGISPAPVA